MAVIITAIIAGGGAFYGGTKYAASKNSPANFSRNGGNFPGGLKQGNGTGNRQGGGMINGEIIKKDDKSITVKANDNSSKIIYFSASTTISKFAEGSKNDLQIGDNIMANGTSNSDGSVVAQMIQMRPNNMPGEKMRSE